MKRRAIQVVDLGFGDSGKGSMVDYLALGNRADWIVRFNGGPQAGHNVILPDRRHHTFAQFGSASFQPDVQTLLSRFMLIDPYAMLAEAAHLQTTGAGDVVSRTSIDERCLVITPPQQIENRLRERARGKEAHGTCGMGIGQCVADAQQNPGLALHAGDLRDPAIVNKKLQSSLEQKSSELRELLALAAPMEKSIFEDSSWIATAVDMYSEIARRAKIISSSTASQILRESSCLIFEGAQGVLLDERYGFHPHTTWSKTTFTNADALLDEAGFDADRQRLGVIRPYLTRHGNGPFVTEDERVCSHLPEPHNRDDGWPGQFRRGLLDLVMLRYAIQACDRIDGIALTCLDHLPGLPPVACDGYELNGRNFVPEPSDELSGMERLTLFLKKVTPHYRPWLVNSADAFINELRSAIDVPITYQSHGPTRRQKRNT